MMKIILSDGEEGKEDTEVEGNWGNENTEGRSDGEDEDLIGKENHIACSVTSWCPHLASKRSPQLTFP